MWYLFALISGFLGAVLAIIVRLYLKQFNPFFVTFIFSIIMAIVLLLFDLFTKKINCPLITTLSFKEIAPLLIAGIINGIAFSSYVAALSCGKTSGVVAVDRMGILFVVILSLIFLQEALTIKSIIGSLLIILGTACLST